MNVLSALLRYSAFHDLNANTLILLAILLLETANIKDITKISQDIKHITKKKIQTKASKLRKH